MRAAFLFPLLGIVAACAGPVPGVPTQEDRQSAEQFAVQAIEDRFPDYPTAAPVANCIRDHASDEEILLLAGKAGDTTVKSRHTLAIAIAARPDTAACIQANNVPPLG